MLLRRLAGPLVSGTTYRCWVYLGLGGVLTVPFIFVAAVLTGIIAYYIGWNSVTVSLAPLTFIVPPLAIGLIPALRVVHRAAVRALLGVPLPEQPDDTDYSYPWSARWRAAGWLLLHLFVGGLSGILLMVMLPAIIILLIAPFLPERVTLDYEVIVLVMDGGWDDTAYPLLGLALIAGFLYLGAGLRVLLGRAASALLGPSPAERLAVLERQAGQLVERNRLAQELHDSVGHALTVTTLQAGAAARVLDTDPEFVRRALQAIEETGRAALDDLDHVLGLLRDGASGTAPQATLADLETLLAKTRATGVPLTVEIDEGVDRIPAVVSREAYRIVQEGLTNALRHAGRVPITLRLAIQANRLKLEITNPITEAAHRNHHRNGGRGLRGMRERVAVLRGEMSAGVDGDQWRVAVALPLRRVS